MEEWQNFVRNEFAYPSLGFALTGQPRLAKITPGNFVTRARPKGVSYRGEAETENGPVDHSPAERARHGWRALGFQAQRESEAPKVANQKLSLPIFVC